VRAAYARIVHHNPERDRLVLEHVDMARRIAVRIGRKVPPSVTREDLVGAAMLGLAEAADRFDAARGQPFVAFAEKRIRGAVLDELRRGDPMSRRARAQARTIGRTVASLSQQLGRDPEDEEIAAALGVTVEVYRDELEGLTHVGCVPIDSVEAVLADDDDPARQAARRHLSARLVPAIASLPPRDATVLSLYYVEELSYAEIGKLLGVTESRVCQLHGRSLVRLRAALAAEEDVDG
jgi:RNA polymerase sigma factor for flagellar operon FliA